MKNYLKLFSGNLDFLNTFFKFILTKLLTPHLRVIKNTKPTTPPKRRVEVFYMKILK